MLMKWRHSGINVFCGPKIRPCDENAMENLARHIVRASFSQGRMTYIPEESKVIYQSKDGNDEKVFDPLEWIAAMCRNTQTARNNLEKRLSTTLFDRRVGGLVRAEDLATSADHLLHTDDPVSRALDLFRNGADDCIPVVSDDQRRALRGVVRKSDLTNMLIRGHRKK